jgi:hypothetical protein
MELRKRWMVLKRIALVLCMTVVLWPSTLEALAHKAMAIGGVYDDPALAAELMDPDVSQVVYGDLPVGRASLWAAVDVTAPMDLYVALGVPALERLRTFRPQLAVLGPDLPMLDIPVAVPAGLGGLLVITSRIDDAARFHEPFTDTDSWLVGEATVRVPSAGRYYLVAWSVSAVSGKAWIAAGTREVFGWSDLASLPRTINAVRAFHELGPDPRLLNMWKVLYLSVVALLIACLALP